jgi:hypothetical protein
MLMDMSIRTRLTEPGERPDQHKAVRVVLGLILTESMTIKIWFENFFENLNLNLLIIVYLL